MPNPTTQPSQAAREAAERAIAELDARGIYSRKAVLTDEFARFERDTEKRVRESVVAQEMGYDIARRLRDYATDSRYDIMPAVRAIMSEAADALSRPRAPSESLAGEANVERVALREKVARAFDERWPFYMPGPQNIDGHRVARRFDWDSAPAFHQDECYEKADIALAAVFGRAALATQPPSSEPRS